ncbi:hypothetical protein Poly30_55720 [Planctomycetes bacterium Poly30]|uniref:Uncharacterized protein n=1 Tax=Saltatorellus ferox TaxID=2528018 RepID=A0A518F0Y7_9BACT|nr:hypothetical protein Poly30_55720 [Planctomycetes bacterium Poly30]
MKLPLLTAAASTLFCLAPNAAADLTTYNQDFEAADIMSPTALSDVGFVVFANVFDSMGGYLYGYGTFPAPNGSGAFSDVASGSAGAAQGTQYINAFSDYNNGDHANGNVIEANVFQEQVIGAGDVGNTWTLDFDYLKSPNVINGDGNTQTIAFIKVLKQSDGTFATLALDTLDTTNASTSTWASGSLSVFIDPSLAGELLQFGFASTATNYDDSGRYYDNISFDGPGGQPPTLTAYAQDFESLDMMSPTALGADNWDIFANVFDSGGGYLYGYGVFDAPNGGAGFSAIATGDGGPFQMAQYLNAYSDYGNMDHGIGNVINANVFQEQTVGAANAGETWRFSFDYRKNATVTNGDGATTTQAFIKVIKVSDGSFATLFLNEFDSTSASTNAWASTALDILIDPTYAGEVLQFGFSSFATNYDDSGRYYDNVDFNVVANPGFGEIICLGNPGSTGVGSFLTVGGSTTASDNNLILTVDSLTPNSLGYFIHSTGSNVVYNPGGSAGHVCIGGGALGRFNGNVLNSGAAGTVTFNPDLTSFPLPGGAIAVVAGDTRNFQYWTRDISMSGPTSNFSSAVSVMFN